MVSQYLIVWMAHSFLELSQDKTEVLVIGSKALWEKMAVKLKALILSN